MGYFPASNAIVVLSVFILSLSLSEKGIAQQPNRMMMMRQFQAPGLRNRGPPVMCTHDSLLIYHDCRLCVCPRPNRIAKCFKKASDLRTKDSGQCPPSLLRMDDGRNCPIIQTSGCKIDADCPGPQLCCFDFCGSPKCANPMPLDVTTGLQIHVGRGYNN